MAFLVSRKQAGAQSATYLCAAPPIAPFSVSVTPPVSVDYIGPAQWSELPAGTLYDLMNAIYRKNTAPVGDPPVYAEDYEAFVEAAATVGFHVAGFEPASQNTDVGSLFLSDGSEGYPALGVPYFVTESFSETGAATSVRFITSYSASE